MGWLKIGARDADRMQAAATLKEGAERVELIGGEILPSDVQYPFVATCTRDEELPFIPAEEVVKRNSAAEGGLWIIINSVVFDATAYITHHPGGEQVIKSFAGAECGWQFWRFHGPNEMQEVAQPLRIGRTKGVPNAFEEPSRWVGLRRGGDDDW